MFVAIVSYTESCLPLSFDGRLRLTLLSSRTEKKLKNFEPFLDLNYLIFILFHHNNSKSNVKISFIYSIFQVDMTIFHVNILRIYILKHGILNREHGLSWITARWVKLLFSLLITFSEVFVACDKEMSDLKKYFHDA